MSEPSPIDAAQMAQDVERICAQPWEKESFETLVDFALTVGLATELPKVGLLSALGHARTRLRQPSGAASGRAQTQGATALAEAQTEVLLAFRALSEVATEDGDKASFGGHSWLEGEDGERILVWDPSGGKDGEPDDDLPAHMYEFVFDELMQRIVDLARLNEQSGDAVDSFLQAKHDQIAALVAEETRRLMEGI